MPPRFELQHPLGRRTQDWLLGLLLAVATILAYQPVWQAGFIWDDDVYVTGNKLLTAPDGLRRIWLSQDSPSQYFPLVYTTFRLEHAVWGCVPPANAAHTRPLRADHLAIPPPRSLALG
jgi:hypothetical protein